MAPKPKEPAVGAATAAQSTTTKVSTESGQGSAPLSDPYIAKGKDANVVEEPAGASQLTVQRRSSHLSAAVQCHSVRRNDRVFIRNVPGLKPSTGWQYEVLREEADEGTSHVPSGVPAAVDGQSGFGGGLRDTVVSQAGLKPGAVTSGRKRTVTSEAPGAGSRKKGSSPLALALDFSDDHWKEPRSDAHLPSIPRFEPPSTSQGPPMQLDHSAAANHIPDCSSSPISGIPLLLPRNHPDVPNDLSLHRDGRIPSGK
jgi:hypothetical protein